MKQRINEVYYAVHRGDSLYVDNSDNYFKALSDLTGAREGEEYRVLFQMPYLDLRKSEALERGSGFGVPVEHTWSCVLGEAVHCGTCDPCRDRQVAFAVADRQDPVENTKPLLTDGSVPVGRRH